MSIRERLAAWLAPSVSLQIRFAEMEARFKQRGQTIDALCKTISAQKREIAALNECVAALKREIPTRINVNSVVSFPEAHQ